MRHLTRGRSSKIRGSDDERSSPAASYCVELLQVTKEHHRLTVTADRVRYFEDFLNEACTSSMASSDTSISSTLSPSSHSASTTPSSRGVTL